MARLIDRPATMLSCRMSGRRSYTVTRWPSRARKIESSEPTRPAPMMAASGLSGRILLQYTRALPHIRKRVVQRSRCHTHDIGLTEIAGHTVGGQFRDKSFRILFDTYGNLRPSPLRLTRRDDFTESRGQAVDQELEIAGELLALLADRRHRCVVEDFHRGTQGRKLEDWWI